MSESTVRLHNMSLESEIKLIGPELSRRLAMRFSEKNPLHIDYAADLLAKKNKIGVIGFNGIYGLFTNVESRAANARIRFIKGRPEEKKLVLVTPPEYLHEYVDFSRTSFSHEQVIKLQKSLHALGVILPASDRVPGHILESVNDQKTVLSIWTEYGPIRKLMESFREQGGRALAGTSANISGQPTHIDIKSAWKDFNGFVDFTIEGDYSYLPEIRRQSTSIIDLTKDRPRLHRLGNVTQEEIVEGLRKFDFPDLQIEKEKLLLVRPKNISSILIPEKAEA